MFRHRGYISKNLIHLTDWLPTFYAAGGGNVADLGKIDGINQWDPLWLYLPSNRREILINIDEVENNFAIISGKFKLIQGVFDIEIYYLINYCI